MTEQLRARPAAEYEKKFLRFNLQRQLSLISLLALACSPLFAATTTGGIHHRAPHRRFHRLHWTRWNPMFRPSHESLLLQNAEVDRLELPRIEDDDELEALKFSGALQPIIAGETLRFDPRLDPSRRYCRPWTRDFVQDLAQAYYNRFHDQIQVNSAVRTVKIQKKLRRHNRNAAPAEGDTASSHLAGLTVDIQRRGMTQEQIHWVQHYLFYMKALGLVEPEEERHQWVFHIMVSGRYGDWRETQDVVPVERAEPATMTADALSSK